MIIRKIYRNILWKINTYVICKKHNKEKNAIKDEVIEWASGYGDLYKNEIAFIKKNGVQPLPYFWNKFGKLSNIFKIKYGFDDNEESYIIHNGKKIYMGLLDYQELELEQNTESPHRYFTDTFKVEQGDIFVDVGAAEGLISLDVVENASEVYLLECDEEWISKLNKTFEPWKDKIHIIPKFASDICDDNNVTLDSLFKESTKPIMVKMDVEGMESVVLSGAQDLLMRDNVKFAVCTYHRAEDKETIVKLFMDKGYKIEYTNGYFLMKEKPYFRTAVLRAWK